MALRINVVSVALVITLQPKVFTVENQALKSEEHNDKKHPVLDTVGCKAETEASPQTVHPRPT